MPSAPLLGRPFSTALPVQDDPVTNLNNAFEVAEKYLDIPKMLDAEGKLLSRCWQIPSRRHRGRAGSRRCCVPGLCDHLLPIQEPLFSLPPVCGIHTAAPGPGVVSGSGRQGASPSC